MSAPVNSTTTGVGPSALLSAVANTYLGQLTTWSAGTFRSNPAIINLGAYGKYMGSGTQQFTLYGLNGHDLMTAYGEAASVPDTAIQAALRTVTPERNRIARSYTDDLRSRDHTGAINPLRMAADGFASAGKTFVYKVGQLAGTWTKQVDENGNPMTYDIFKRACNKLVNVGGAYAAMLGDTQYTELTDDMYKLGGAIQWMPATLQMQMLMGGSIFKGFLNGVAIYAFPDMKTTNAGADFNGQIIATGSVGYAEEAVAPSSLANVIAAAGALFIEGVRNADGQIDRIISNYRVGFVRMDTDAAVDVITRKVA